MTNKLWFGHICSTVQMHSLRFGMVYVCVCVHVCYISGLYIDIFLEQGSQNRKTFCSELCSWPANDSFDPFNGKLNGDISIQGSPYRYTHFLQHILWHPVKYPMHSQMGVMAILDLVCLILWKTIQNTISFWLEKRQARSRHDVKGVSFQILEVKAFGIFNVYAQRRDVCTFHLGHDVASSCKELCIAKLLGTRGADEVYCYKWYMQ